LNYFAQAIEKLDSTIMAVSTQIISFPSPQMMNLVIEFIKIQMNPTFYPAPRYKSISDPSRVVRESLQRGKRTK